MLTLADGEARERKAEERREASATARYPAEAYTLQVPPFTIPEEKSTRTTTEPKTWRTAFRG